MNILAVGDVHGCYHTFKQLVEEHWNPENEFLIQVGDLINKGRNSGKVYAYARRLQDEYPYQVFFLKGNHEERFIKLHNRPGVDKLIDKCKKDFVKRDINIKRALEWMKALPLKWENPSILITHAGISPFSKDPYGPNARRGVLHNRSSLKNIGKVQVHGHLLLDKGEPAYSSESNSWCIDTAAWTGKKLTALRLNYDGQVLEKIQVNTHPKDIR
ncbi:MAG: serine/threonine protein phosphatase [Bacteroidetes bacterium]|nr:MAG: serine/threonine protein phosphatase [Bacteroidota bacterium]